MAREIQFNRNRGTRAPMGPRLILISGILVVIIGIIKFNAIKAWLGSFSAKPPVAKRELKPNEVWLPLTAQPILAYSRIMPNSVTQIAYPKSRLTEDVLINPSDFLGRIAAVDIEPNKMITEKLLLDKKNPRTGPTGGIRPGWVAQKLDRNEIVGQLDDLHSGDYIALLTPSGKWISRLGQVLIPYKELPNVIPGVPQKIPIVDPRPKSKTVTEGKITIALPPEDCVQLNKVLGREKVRILALNSWAPEIDVLPVDPLAEEKNESQLAVRRVENIQRGKIRVEEVPAYNDKRKPPSMGAEQGNPFLAK